MASLDEIMSGEATEVARAAKPPKEHRLSLDQLATEASSPTAEVPTEKAKEAKPVKGKTAPKAARLDRLAQTGGFAADLASLKGLSAPEKLARKRELLRHWEPLARVFLKTAAPGETSEFVPTVLVWMFDVGEVEPADYLSLVNGADRLKLGGGVLAKKTLFEFLVWSICDRTDELFKMRGKLGDAGLFAEVSPWLLPVFEQLDQQNRWADFGAKFAAKLWYFQFHLACIAAEKAGTRQMWAETVDLGLRAMEHKATIKGKLLNAQAVLAAFEPPTEGEQPPVD